MWCGVVCGVVWCGVVWCGVVWCGVVWCAMVWDEGAEFETKGPEIRTMALRANPNNDGKFRDCVLRSSLSSF